MVLVLSSSKLNFTLILKLVSFVLTPDPPEGQNSDLNRFKSQIFK